MCIYIYIYIYMYIHIYIHIHISGARGAANGTTQELSPRKVSEFRLNIELEHLKKEDNHNSAFPKVCGEKHRWRGHPGIQPLEGLGGERYWWRN